MATSREAVPSVSTRRLGSVIALLGLVALVAYPAFFVTVLFEDGLADASDLGKLLMLTGACIVVWGSVVYRTGKLRSLTPARAVIIPLLVLGMAITMDTLTDGTLIEILLGGHPGGLTVGNLSLSLPMVVIGASLFPLLGTAVRQRRIAWLLAGILLVLIAFDVSSQWPYTEGMPYLITIVGALPAAFGFLVAEPSENRTD